MSELLVRAAKHLFKTYMQGVETMSLGAGVSHFLNCVLSSFPTPHAAMVDEVGPNIRAPGFYLLVGDKLNTKKQLVLLECLKDAFDGADCSRSFVIMPLARSVVECSQLSTTDLGL